MQRYLPPFIPLQKGLQGLHQAGVAAVGGFVVGVGNAEEGGAPGLGKSGVGLSRNHTGSIGGVFGRGVESQPADSVLHIQLILEMKRNLRWRTGQQEVVRHPGGLHRPGDIHLMPRQKLQLGLTGGIAPVGAAVLLVEGAGLGGAARQQRLQRRINGVRLGIVAGQNETPTRLIETAHIHLESYP